MILCSMHYVVYHGRVGRCLNGSSAPISPGVQVHHAGSAHGKDSRRVVWGLMLTERSMCRMVWNCCIGRVSVVKGQLRSRMKDPGRIVNTTLISFRGTH